MFIGIVYKMKQKVTYCVIRYNTILMIYHFVRRMYILYSKLQYGNCQSSFKAKLKRLVYTNLFPLTKLQFIAPAGVGWVG